MAICHTRLARPSANSTNLRTHFNDDGLSECKRIQTSRGIDEGSSRRSGERERERETEAEFKFDPLASVNSSMNRQIGRNINHSLLVKDAIEVYQEMSPASPAPVEH